MQLIAWCGGAIFVLSLVVTASWYFVALDRAEPFHGLAPLAIDTALVTIFALHHSLFARDAVKARLAAIPAGAMRSFYVWIASALLLAVIALWQPIGMTLYDHRGIALAAHAAAQLFGVWLIVRATSALDPLELAGIRQAGGAELPTPPLLDRGVYGLVRHPLYLGWILALFGAAHMTGDRLAFAALTSAYLVLAVPWEERSLMHTFGEEAYGRYARRVKWRIVPFVY